MFDSLICRCYLRSGDIDHAVKTFEDFINSGKPPAAELYVVSLLTNTISGIC